MRKSLRFKFIVFVLATIVIFVVVGSAFVIMDKRQYLRKELIEKAKLFGLYTARTIYDFYGGYYVYRMDEDLQKFKTQVKEILSRNKDVSHLVFINVKGEILFDSLEFTEGWYKLPQKREVTDKVLLEEIKKLEESVSRGIIEPSPGRVIKFFGRDTLELLCPVTVGDLLAAVVIYHVSLESISEAITKTTWVIIAISLGFIIAGILLVIFLANIVTRPITELIRGVKRISSGELNYKVFVKAKDEIGMLADSFNRMTGNLNKITVSRDELVKEITERKKAEEKLRLAYDQLEKTQAQLVQSSKMASVGLLAGGVAHEINNPLTGVLNNVQLIKMMSEEGKEVGYDEFKEILSTIEESALRCKKITQSLLDFSHASKGAYTIILLNEIAEKIISLIQHELTLQNIEIKKELEPSLPPILGDAQLLQQVIFDMVSNARWAIKKKGNKEEGVVTVRTAHNKKENLAYLFISDNGIGIAKENLSRIFEPFFTTKAVGEGTGLGLSIVYNIVQAHKGTVEVESELDKGTTFKISFPIFSPV